VRTRADVDSDHNSVVATAAVKLKKVLRTKNVLKVKPRKLKDEGSYSSLSLVIARHNGIKKKPCTSEIFNLKQMKTENQRTASDKACQKPAENSKRLNRKR